MQHGLDVVLTEFLIHTPLHVARVAPRNRFAVLVNDVVSSTRLRNFWRPQSIVLLIGGKDDVDRERSSVSESPTNCRCSFATLRDDDLAVVFLAGFDVSITLSLSRFGAVQLQTSLIV
jgi:hypothetical protein